VINKSINFEEPSSVIHLVLSHMMKWLAANKLVLNLDTTEIMKCITNNSSHSASCIGYKEKYTEDAVNIKFLGIQTDNNLNWKNNIKKLFLSYVVHVMPLG
jgi:hypothetical protein